MKRGNINWEEAPKGTTHFFTGEDLVIGWHKLEGGVWSFFRHDKWQDYNQKEQEARFEDLRRGDMVVRYLPCDEAGGLAELNDYPWVIPYRDLKDRKDILRLLYDAGINYQIHDSPNGTGLIFSPDPRYGYMPVTLNLKREAYLEIVDIPTKGEIEERIEFTKTKLKQLEAMNEKQLGRI